MLVPFMLAAFTGVPVFMWLIAGDIWLMAGDISGMEPEGP
jgi:hypothetical protein